MAAHHGSCRDHVLMLRSMMTWGLSPPGFKLSDTVALFECI